MKAMVLDLVKTIPHIRRSLAARQHRSKAVLLMALSGCFWSCGPEVLPATAHAPLDPVQVKVYQAAPAKYEKLGTLTWTVKGPQQAWREDADGTPAFEDLRAQAAKKGANGILLVDEAHQEWMMVGARYQGKSYLLPLRKEPMTVAVEAIFVHEE
jgi:hypothetical protein